MPVASDTPPLEHYALPGGRIGGFQNGLAIAGDFMSAATILGMSAIIFSAGFDVVIYLAAPMAAFLIVILLVTDS